MRKPFFVRCYAKQQQDQWVAVCVDLDLAAQGDSFDEVKEKLKAQIVEYVRDALTVDRDHARELLLRKAPITQRAEYQWYRIANKLTRTVAPRKATPQRMHSAAFDDVVPYYSGAMFA